MRPEAPNLEFQRTAPNHHTDRPGRRHLATPQLPSIGSFDLVRAILLFFVLIVPATAGTPADDATLTRRLIGTWQGSRHSSRYFADGTWMMDPQDYAFLKGQNTNGRWFIKHGRLIETWRFNGETRDSMVTYVITKLTADTLVIRTLSNDGPRLEKRTVLSTEIYTLLRVPSPRIPHRS